MDQVIKSIGERVRKARLAKHMSQAQLAEALNISPSHMSNIEMGKHAMNVATLYQICDLLDVSADWIVRSDTTEGRAYTADELRQIIDDCSPAEAEALLSVFQFAKERLRDVIQSEKTDS